MTVQIQEPGTHFERIGGESNIRALSERFYDVMETDPRAKEILAMHPYDLTEVRHKFYEFLVGWMGGPQLYMNKYGHPRLRMRHNHVPVNESARDQWMYCMMTAMKDIGLSEVMQKELTEAFYKVADFMRNTG